MLHTEIELTEEERSALEEISLSTGKTEDELIRAALDQFIAQFRKEDPHALMRAARGIWEDRQDLPSLRELRDEFDRLNTR